VRTKVLWFDEDESGRGGMVEGWEGVVTGRTSVISISVISQAVVVVFFPDIMAPVVVGSIFFVPIIIVPVVAIPDFVIPAPIPPDVPPFSILLNNFGYRRSFLRVGRGFVSGVMGLSISLPPVGSGVEITAVACSSSVGDDCTAVPSMSKSDNC